MWTHYPCPKSYVSQAYDSQFAARRLERRVRGAFHYQWWGRAGLAELWISLDCTEFNRSIHLQVVPCTVFSFLSPKILFMPSSLHELNHSLSIFHSMLSLEVALQKIPVWELSSKTKNTRSSWHLCALAMVSGISQNCTDMMTMFVAESLKCEDVYSSFMADSQDGPASKDCD